MGYELNVAVVYEDAVTREWARQVREQLIEEAGEKAVHCTQWKIDDLRQPELFREGAVALAKADAIVIALYEQERLPAQFYLWLNLWLQQRDGLPGALIGLIGTSRESGSASIETRRYLHSMASQGHLDLMLKRCDLTAEPADDLREGLLQWAHAA